MDIEVKRIEPTYVVSLNQEEFDMLYGLLGTLDKNTAIEDLGMTKEQYNMSYGMYNHMDDIKEEIE